jgi:hypothetical protein
MNAPAPDFPPIRDPSVKASMSPLGSMFLNCNGRVYTDCKSLSSKQSLRIVSIYILSVCMCLGVRKVLQK